MSGPVGDLALIGNLQVPAIGDSGRAARELTSGQPPIEPTVLDHSLCEYAAPDIEIRGASIRGLLHRYRGEQRQDTFSVTYDQPTRTTLLVVCDGVGSLSRSHEAAALVAARLPIHYWPQRNWREAIAAVNDELIDVVDRRHWGSGSPGGSDMATTVAAVAITPGLGGWRVTTARTDDTTVWTLDHDHVWTAVSADLDQEENGVHTGSVRALPHRAPRVQLTEFTFHGCALFVMTDGVGVPLAGSAQVQQTLARWWSAPPAVFDFGRQVGFARKGHLDDRTVVGAWPAVQSVLRR